MTEQHTGLYDRQAQLGAKFVDFAGWQMPIQFSGLRQDTKPFASTVGSLTWGIWAGSLGPSCRRLP